MVPIDGSLHSEAQPLKALLNKSSHILHVLDNRTGNHRDLALFNFAIYSKLRVCDLVKMKGVEVLIAFGEMRWQ